MLPELTDTLLKKWGNWFPDKAKPKEIHFLGLPGSLEGGTTTYLAFTLNNPTPICVIKLYRDSKLETSFRNERNVLRQIEQSKCELAQTIPKVIYTDKIFNTWTLVQSIVPGAPMQAAMTPQGIPHLKKAAHNYDLALNWLVELRKINLWNRDQAQSAFDDKKQNIFKEFRELFPLTESEESTLKDLEVAAFSMENKYLTIQHGDYCRQNILVPMRRKDAVGVVDWTDSSELGFPMHDLFFFMTTYYLQIRKKCGIEGFHQAFQDTFFDQNEYQVLVKKFILEYVHQMGCKAADVKNYFGLFLIERSIHEARKIKRCEQWANWPRLALSLAETKKLSYSELHQAQFWIDFFKLFVCRQNEFLN